VKFGTRCRAIAGRTAWCRCKFRKLYIIYSSKKKLNWQKRL